MADGEGVINVVGVIAVLAFILGVVFFVRGMAIREVRKEAVKAGAAAWVSDESGAPIFEWNSCDP